MQKVVALAWMLCLITAAWVRSLVLHSSFLTCLMLMDNVWILGAQCCVCWSSAESCFFTLGFCLLIFRICVWWASTCPRSCSTSSVTTAFFCLKSPLLSSVMCCETLAYVAAWIWSWGLVQWQPHGSSLQQRGSLSVLGPMHARVLSTPLIELVVRIELHPLARAENRWQKPSALTLHINATEHCFSFITKADVLQHI